MSLAGRVGRMIHILHHKEVKAVEDLTGLGLVDPGMSGIRTDNPKSANPATQNAFHDFGIGPARSRRNACGVQLQDLSHFAAMFSIGKVMASLQIGRVRKQPRPHRVALAGN